MLSLASLTPRRLMRLAWLEGGAAACLRAVRAGRAASQGDQERARSVDTAAAVAALRSSAARLVAFGEPDYPAALADLHDPPAGLFLRGATVPGNGEWAARPVLAVVGARNCSPAGREIAHELARAVAAAGGWVVSGAARGIDSAAHRGALAAGGPTAAILGSGIDVPYPTAHRSLIESIAATGAVISEYPPGTPAEPFRFPARNRIVAGLSRALLVVEGATGSGSMISADHALEIGRDVLAVPGPITSPLSEVPLALIREGATLIRGPADLLAELGLEEAAAPARSGHEDPVVSGDEAAVLERLAAPAPADALGVSTGLPLPRVMAALAGLEVRGLVRRSGGRFERRGTLGAGGPAGRKISP